jgi:hypothetical protein
MAKSQLHRLEKLQPSHEDWSASATVPDSVLILAEDEQQARYRAAVRMWIPKDHPCPSNPWLRTDMVRVELVPEAEGPADIIVFPTPEKPRPGRPRQYWTLSKPLPKSIREE